MIRRVVLPLTLLLLLPAAAHAVVPGANGRIAFQAEPTPDSPDIFTVDPDGTDLQAVTEGKAWDEEPAWSPDGKRIVFHRLRSGLWTVKADGSGARRILGDALDPNQPAWSPDGRRILFAGGRGKAGRDLYTVRPDGKGLERVLRSKRKEAMPAWSPDGRRIAFIRAKGDTSRVFVAAASGKKARRVSPRGETSALSPAFSPDGEQLLFTDSFNTVYIAAADGSGVRELGEGSEPVFSPDGTQVAFSMQDDFGSESRVHVAPLDAFGERTRLSPWPSSYFAAAPDWQPVRPASAGRRR